MLPVVNILTFKTFSVWRLPYPFSVPHSFTKLSVIQVAVDPFIDTSSIKQTKNEISLISIAIRHNIKSSSMFPPILDVSIVNLPIWILHFSQPCLLSINEIAYVPKIVQVYRSASSAHLIFSPQSSANQSIFSQRLEHPITTALAIHKLPFVDMLSGDILKTLSLLDSHVPEACIPASNVERAIIVPDNDLLPELPINAVEVLLGNQFTRGAIQVHPKQDVHILEKQCIFLLRIEWTRRRQRELFRHIHLIINPSTKVRSEFPNEIIFPISLTGNMGTDPLFLN